MVTITVRQYQSTDPLTLQDGPVAHLLSAHAKHLDFLPASGGAIALRGNKYVGVLRVPDLDVLVQPKIDVLSVFWILGFAPRRWEAHDDEVGYAAQYGLLEFLALIFARETEHLLLRGLYREYVERSESLPYVRGRFDVMADIRTQRGLHHVIACRFADLTADVPHNQILRSTCELLLRFDYRLPAIRRTLAWCSANLSEASAPRMTAPEIERLT